MHIILYNIIIFLFILLIHVKELGYLFLVNDLQNPKRSAEEFLAYVSDDFKTKKKL